MTQTFMPIILPIHTNTTKEVNCITEQGVRYCEKPLGSNMSDTMLLGMSIISVLWVFGLIYTMIISIEKGWSLIWVGLYILTPIVILFILSL